MNAHFVGLAGGFIRYAELPGSGVPIVWLHGVICSSTAELLPVAVQAPLRQRRSILVDFLGYGYSDRPSTFVYSVEEHARTIESLIDGLQIDRCHLVGHSLGGTVAAIVAARRPDLVASLVMAESNLDAGGGGISTPIAEQSEDEFVKTGLPELITRHETSAREEPLGILARHLGMVRALDARGVHRTATSLVRGTDPPVSELLKEMRMPRAFVNGASSDQALGPQPDLISAGVDWLTVPDTGHAMGLQNPLGFSEKVSETIGAD